MQPDTPEVDELPAKTKKDTPEVDELPAKTKKDTPEVDERYVMDRVTGEVKIIDAKKEKDWQTKYLHQSGTEFDAE